MDEEIEAPLDDLEALAEDEDGDLGDGGSGSRGGSNQQGGGGGSTIIAAS